MSPVRGATLRVLVLLLLLSASIPAPVRACLWDYDTLRDEKRGLPGIAEVLAGKWEKHSRFFYEQRVRKMRDLLARDPGNLAAWDNLAVAYEKLDDRDSAIEAMKSKERVKPGEYTTWANLGTFYLHKGDLDQGIDCIRKALAINPDAHFGREEYQFRLAEFLRAGRAEPRLLKATDFLMLRDGKALSPSDLAEVLQTGIMPPAAPEPATEPSSLPAGFPASRPTSRRADTDPDADKPDPDLIYTTDEYDSIWASRGSPGRLRELGFKDNVFDGIVGMIRFGTGTSAELYLTLGDLLALRGDKNLAYRAYQRTLDLSHPRRGYLKAAMRDVGEMIYDKTSIQPEAIAAERADADAWVAAYQAYEDNLLREGKDVDDEANYAAFYRKRGPAKLADPFRVADYVNVKTAPAWVAAGLGASAVFMVVSMVVVARRRARCRAGATG